ncbi:cytochrome P450 [Xylariaceae sp. FL0662B]|nr:cytochrome P450 [Xylariaceae sp. FL0662B]
MELFGLSHLYVGAVALSTALLWTLIKEFSSPLSKIPGPWYSRWTTLVSRYYRLKGRLPAYVHSLHQQYGPIVRISPHEVDVANPAAAQKIHQVNKEYRKSSFYADLVPTVTSVFSTIDVEIHRRHRRLLSSPISESGLKIFIPQVEDKVRLAIQRIGEESKNRGAADILKWCIFMTTDVIGELTFGESFHMLELGRKNQYSKDLEVVGILGGVRATFPFLTRLAMNSVPVPFIKGVAAATCRIKAYAQESLQRHKELVDNNSAKPRPTLFSKMYKACDEETLNPVEIRDNAQTYIVAGSDTTANTLTYLLWSVCRHPEIKARLLEELRTLPEDFTDDNLKTLSYLTKIIDETLRLYSAVPAGLPRLVPSGGAELGGYFVPEQCTVLTQAYSLHRNAEAFSNPERFDPSRWEKPTRLMKDSYMPFGGGSRICIGLHLARIELRLATARFFLAYPNARVSEKEGMSDQDMIPALYFLLSPSGNRCLVETS